MILLILGMFAIQPFVLPQQPLSTYSHRAVIYGLLSGALNSVGSWGLFEAICPLAEETRDPRRTIPRAILLSITLMGLSLIHI